MVRLDVLQQPAFDPATARRTFTVITPDIGETVFMPKILAYVQAHAPHIAMRSVAISSEGAGEALELGQADLAIGYFRTWPSPASTSSACSRTAGGDGGIRTHDTGISHMHP
jgi:DNA-binding transcriptional LysR family regulator